MKNLKFGLFSLLTFIAFTLILSSCGKEELASIEDRQEETNVPENAAKMIAEIENSDETSSLFFKTPENLSLEEAAQWVSSLSEEEMLNLSEIYALSNEVNSRTCTYTQWYDNWSQSLSCYSCASNSRDKLVYTLDRYRFCDYPNGTFTVEFAGPYNWTYCNYYCP